jgi:hypothetical protein
MADDAVDLAANMVNLNAIPAADVREPNMPVYVLISEALMTEALAIKDKEALATRNLDFTLVESLESRACTLRAADTNLMVASFGTSELAQKFIAVANEATILRRRMAHDMLYAFQGYEQLLEALRDIKEGGSYPDLVQDCSNIKGLGVKNAELLKKANVDMQLIERCGELARELGSLLAKSTVEKLEHSPEKDILDRAFTYLDMAVSKIRACGQSVFWEDPKHAALYASAYQRKQRRKTEKKKKAAAKTTV